MESVFKSYKETLIIQCFLATDAKMQRGHRTQNHILGLRLRLGGYIRFRIQLPTNCLQTISEWHLDLGVAGWRAELFCFPTAGPSCSGTVGQAHALPSPLTDKEP